MAKTNNIHKILETGLYTVREAAMYARLHHNTLLRWLKDNDLQIVENEKFVSFLDFIQALAIRDIRRQHKISLQKIRDAAATAKDKYGIEYPFARKHTTYLVGREIYIVLPEDENPVQLSGDKKDQIAFRKIIEVYMKDLSFGKNGLANLYKPINGIVMDPKLRFGEPLVEPSKIPVVALWEAIQTEGSFEAAAEIYGVSVDEVYTASKYIETLELKAA